MATITSKVVTAGWLEGGGTSWVGDALPVLGTDNAVIASGAVITMDGVCECGDDPGAGLDGLTINGTLIPSTTVDSSLKVRGCISVKSGGVFHDGTILNATYGVRKHTCEIDCVDAAGKYYLCNEDDGVFKPNSALPDPWDSRLAADCDSAQNVVKVTDSVQGVWKVGGLIVIPHCITDDTGYIYLQTEIKEIAGFNSATEFTVTSNFTYTHNKLITANAKAIWARTCPVVYLDRDITFKSTNTTYPAWVNNSTVTDMSNWYPKGVEFKELGKSAAQPSICYATSPASVPAYNNPAYGNMSGISIHPGLNKKGFPGFLYALYKSPGDLDDHNFDDIVVVGNAIAGADGGSTYLFSEAYSNTHIINIDKVFCFGSSGLSAINFGGQLNQQKLVTVNDLECAGFVYGVILAKVGQAKDIHIWGNAYIGIYQTSLNFNAENVVAIAGYYSVFGSAYSIKNNILNLYTKSALAQDIANVPDIEITNWVSAGAIPYGTFAGLIELRANDYNCVEDNFFTVNQQGVSYSCKSTLTAPQNKIRTSGHGAILLDPHNAIVPFEVEYQVAVESGKQIVISGYMYKDAAYNGSVEPGVTLSGAGMVTSTMLYTSMIDAGSGWYLFIVSGTPTRTTQAFFTISCIGTLGHIVVADMIVLGPNVNTGDCNNWAHGRGAVDLFAVQISAPDIATAVWEKIITGISPAGSAAKQLNDVKTQTDKMNFTGTDIKATLDGETVAVSDKTGFSLISDYDPAKSAASQTSVNTIDGVVDNIFIDTNITIPDQISNLSIPTAEDTATAVWNKSSLTAFAANTMGDLIKKIWLIIKFIAFAK